MFGGERSQHLDHVTSTRAGFRQAFGTIVHIQAWGRENSGVYRPPPRAADESQDKCTEFIPKTKTTDR